MTYLSLKKCAENRKVLTSSKFREISDLLNSQNTMLRNLHTARRLDIASEDDWETLRQEVRDARSDAPKRFAGAIMRE